MLYLFFLARRIAEINDDEEDKCYDLLLLMELLTHLLSKDFIDFSGPGQYIRLITLSFTTTFYLLSLVIFHYNEIKTNIKNQDFYQNKNHLRIP